MSGAKPMRGTKPEKPKPGFLGALVKLIRFLIGFALVILVIGYGVFCLYIAKTKPADSLPDADGIVVLTGKGGGRLAAGGSLLKAGHGERLLISGVNPANDGKTVQSLLGLSDEKFSCCVDLDYAAENTYGNGRETEIWASALGYETIILVTSSYHMPRAKVEIGAAHPGLKIIPHPVKSDAATDQPWWGGKAWHKQALREYGKLLIAYTREPGARSNQMPPAVQPETNK